MVEFDLDVGVFLWLFVTHEHKVKNKNYWIYIFVIDWLIPFCSFYLFLTVLFLTVKISQKSITFAKHHCFCFGCHLCFTFKIWFACRNWRFLLCYICYYTLFIIQIILVSYLSLFFFNFFDLCPFFLFF